MWLFYYFNFERNYDVLKSKSPCILLNKNINLNKNEAESKMENPTHSFRETSLVLQLIRESQIKSKSVMSWSLRKKKGGHFLYHLLCPNEFVLNICVLFLSIVYWISFHNICTFTYQKTVLHTVLKLLKAFSVSLNVSKLLWFVLPRQVKNKAKNYQANSMW